MSNEIKLMRLTTGEEILCTLKSVDQSSSEKTSYPGNVYHIYDIAILIPTEANQLGLAPFIPYSIASTEGVTLADKDIMFITEPVEALRKQYQTMFSKLVTPNKSIII